MSQRVHFHQYIYNS